jgi:hypothetical protein
MKESLHRDLPPNASSSAKARRVGCGSGTVFQAACNVFRRCGIVSRFPSSLRRGIGPVTIGASKRGEAVVTRITDAVRVRL